MSVSDWKLRDHGASALFRLPFADAVWIMDPNLVFVTEAGVQIKVRVDDQLRDRVRAWVASSIPQKITIEGCTYHPEMKVWFEGVSVQAEAELTCEPGYMDDLKIESHFLVDKNRLHTTERHAHLTQKGQRLVVLVRRGDERDVHAVDLLDPVVVDFWKYHLFLDADRQVAAPVERASRQSTEVANSRHRHVDETIHELVHM